MRRYLLGLCCAALASAAWGQSPVEVSVMPESQMVVPAGTTGAVTSIVSATGQVITASAGCCEGNKCSKRGTVCVPVPDTTTKKKVLFSSDCEVKCHKGCFGCFSLLHRGGDCGSCADGKCGHAHVEHYLYKRVQTETCDSFKCVPTQCPRACTTGACVAASAAASGQSVAGMAPVYLPNTPARATYVAVPPASITPVSAVAPRP